MKVSVFGLGYVGAVSVACLARDGIDVIGVDVNPDKVAMVGSGMAPIIELGLAELLQEAVQSGRLTTTESASDAVQKSDLSLISVGTPSEPHGSINLEYVYKVCEEIGEAIAAKGTSHTVVIRSTVVPGTTERCSRILREHAGDCEVRVAFNPEFLREGTAIRDYDAPPYTLIGTDDAEAEAIVRQVYAAVDAPVIVVRPPEAELIKSTSNAWHATKIAFSNEIGRLAKGHSVDGRVVMDLVTQDTKLNVSAAYMKPGFAYGGSCLPKDVRALLAVAQAAGIELPLLESLDRTNRSHIEHTAQLVRATGKKKVGLLGVAFKGGTDDLRESPAVALIDLLRADGCEVRVLDPAVHGASLMGTNRQYVEAHLPDLSELLVADAKKILAHAEILVITYASSTFRRVIESASEDVVVLDLAGLINASREGRSYVGIGWD